MPRARLSLHSRTLVHDQNWFFRNGSPAFWTGSFRKREGTRASLYAELYRPALQPLRAERYVMADWKTVRASIDYHVEVDRSTRRRIRTSA